jgi:hypothetical protein
MLDAIAETGHARIDHDQPECPKPEPRLANTFGPCRLERDAQAESDQGQAGGGEDHPFLLVGHAVILEDFQLRCNRSSYAQA